VNEEGNNFSFNNGKEERILVCITAQENSKRLISRAADIAEVCGGELHIIHVQNKDRVFGKESDMELLQKLFVYGSEKGGMVHFCCYENIDECIGRLTKDMGITKIMFGQPSEGVILSKKMVLEKLNQILKYVPKSVEIIAVPRQDGIDDIRIKRN